MTLDIAILRLADSLASYASVRQGVIAENIANADTPGYRARDLVPFADILAARAEPAFAPAMTRPGHFNLASGNADLPLREAHAPGTASPNGNTVGLEDQMMRAAELKLQHDLALGVYAKSLAILRAGLGRR
ncbi:MAG: flagellar biosynthesis protein FlgB [Paracoccaceae bacterium]|nr:MAG: FlgB family protein [Alphaproteobacteria bacterium]GIX15474.1 MAG: flagellar biosynthesis protein FlgB [Paracoccaceae bacterium]